MILIQKINYHTSLYFNVSYLVRISKLGKLNKPFIWEWVQCLLCEKWEQSACSLVRGKVWNLQLLFPWFLPFIIYLLANDPSLLRVLILKQHVGSPLLSFPLNCRCEWMRSWFIQLTWLDTREHTPIALSWHKIPVSHKPLWLQEEIRNYYCDKKQEALVRLTLPVEKAKFWLSYGPNPCL